MLVATEITQHRFNSIQQTTYSHCVPAPVPITDGRREQNMTRISNHHCGSRCGGHFLQGMHPDGMGCSWSLSTPVVLKVWHAPPPLKLAASASSGHLSEVQINDAVRGAQRTVLTSSPADSAGRSSFTLNHCPGTGRLIYLKHWKKEWGVLHSAAPFLLRVSCRQGAGLLISFSDTGSPCPPGDFDSRIRIASACRYMPHLPKLASYL